jgi:G3E family GTPase
MLHNKEGLRIGLIVNDVAEVNIDAKLVNRYQQEDMQPAGEDGEDGKGADKEEEVGPGGDKDTIELGNGCACCSMSEELFQSISQLVQMNVINNKPPFHHIVVECSGVAEPSRIRDQFQEAERRSFPVMKFITLHTLVTVVDSSTFVEHYETRDTAEDRPELGTDEFGEGSDKREIVDLLVEQVECADVLITNKADLCTAPALQAVKDAVSALNPVATVHVATRGVVPLSCVLAAAPNPHTSVACQDEYGDHKAAVNAAKAKAEAASSHGHGHGHGAAPAADCGDTDCKDASHSHGHGHGDGASGAGAACTDSDCKDGSHSHGHGHGHGHGAKQETTAKKRFGISSFVYTARRPFQPKRFMDSLVKQMPVDQNTAVSEDTQTALGEMAVEGDSESKKDEVDAAAAAAGVTNHRLDKKANPLACIIRSKGFLWLASHHAASLYWAHAGKAFEIKMMGPWWAGVPQERWPRKYEKAEMMKDFCDPWGDRRQEIVIIGINMDEAKIRAMFDACLLTDDEMDKYGQHWESLKDVVNAGSAQPADAAAGGAHVMADEHVPDSRQ